MVLTSQNKEYMSTNFDETIAFDMPKNQSNVIKVIGVGGGGSNAINHMFSQGIKGVDFVICNTDAQALENSSVPIKIQLGVSLTQFTGLLTGFPQLDGSQENHLMKKPEDGEKHDGCSNG